MRKSIRPTRPHLKHRKSTKLANRAGAGTTIRNSSTKPLSKSAKKFQWWQYGTINVSTCSDDDRLEYAVKSMAEAQLTICGMQEVRRLGDGNKMVKAEVPDKSDKSGKTMKTVEYEVYWSGKQKVR